MVTPSATAKAPAKINLTLEVVGRRGDGYHELRSLVIGVDLCDRICCRLRGELGLELACSDAGLAGGDNLACRAAMKLARYIGREPDLGIELEKTIPVGAGLGGGSSDAAATLRLCNDLWKAGLDRDELAAIGAEIGSDVPLFFSLPSAVITGRGERVEPVTLSWSGWVLLAFAGVEVSTAEVFRAWRPTDGPRLPRETNGAIIRAATADEMSAMLSNRLEPAVFRVSPAVPRAYDELNRAGFGPMRVSGAGSAMYRLFDEEEAARHAAKTIKAMRIGITTSVVAAPAEPGSIVCEEH